MSENDTRSKRKGSATPAEGLEGELYAKHQKIYPRQVHGLFARLRVTALLVLLGIYYGLPWVQWDGRQAVLFDLPERKFHVFGLTFWPQDFFLLAVLLVIAALSLFFFTALAGRLWCGYACPQTVWTEAFLRMERWFEGDRAKQMKLDKAPWTRDKILRKTGKHTAWAAFALFTGLTFVGYFVPIADLIPRFFTLNTGAWETFWILFYGFATWGNAGFMREQVCIYMCPYARFQSAMFDKDTLIISYDEERGEPRGPRKKGVDHKAKGLGDCIECTLCVQVCPTGIDIRDGLQYQCIGCSACVDVCDEVMEKMNYPKGLIRYTTENAMAGTPAKILRPRVILYGMLLLVLLAGFVYGVGARNPVGIDVIRDRNVLYRDLPDGQVENVYTLKLTNRSNETRHYVIDVSGVEGAELAWEEGSFVEVPPGRVIEFPASVRVDPAALDRASSELMFHAQVVDRPELSNERSSRFVGPIR
ncbi:Type cbb3 cytochrome oxidase biogenesis protein CcoG, involved in Cu oxidation [Thioalkalivibrio nitratireducens DSM 14787]|uniref:Type cbb3 cytochrome oxidase biogenesis protein CcoG, involved in Cu oxidation n=1 Tax=Thioalkalivibrio nitratireducens (strain DSM 14787 / UNIQEM 213 / ALEN2) TaxID=1255043 RepID=L0DXU4_THIND|nr:cytochrome c oxidase accessory protein CcoG [Thioalkalivibrio nitratireducens]AGA33837.1 Type cbb3 cytochrome oxidase biogenesis protein CcoG, involved in Cu oxidation [Thioalkalivibrio nitratireducens DSM 14787]